MTKWLKNEEGSGLVLAIMTLLVLSVLGASLGTITLSGHQLSNVNRDSSSAYYIAEAGANMAYEEIKDIVTEVYEESSNRESFYQALDSLIEIDFDTYNDFASQFGHQPVATIKVNEITNGDTRSYIIESKANIGDHSRTAQKEVTVNWVNKDTSGGTLPPLPEGVSLIANSSISFTNGQIVGDIYLNTLEDGTFEISNSGSVSGNTSKIYVPGANSDNIYKTTGGNPPLESFRNRTFKSSNSIVWETYENIANNFPEYPNFPLLENKEIKRNSNTHKVHDNGNLRITNYLANGYEWNLEESVTINTLSITENNTLNINTHGNSFSIVINHLDVSNGHINVLGGGAITLYVKERITMGSGSTINKNGTQSNLNLFYQGTPLVNMGGSQHINGSIFVKNADLDVGSGASIDGVILSGGNKVKFSGGTHTNTFLISPYANLKLEGGAKVHGIAITDRIELSGGTELSYMKYNLESFPFGISENINNPEQSIEDIINAEPTKEP